MITIKDSKKEGHEVRSDGYTKLIDNYVNGIRRNTWAKFIMKMLFFAIVMFILSGLVYTFHYTITYTISMIQNMIKSNHVSFNMITATLTPLVSSFGTIIISLLKLPEIIAKYLFNPQEDESAVAIVKNIQKYDIRMYPMLHNVNEKLEEEQTDDISDKWQNIKDTIKEEPSEISLKDTVQG